MFDKPVSSQCFRSEKSSRRGDRPERRRSVISNKLRESVIKKQVIKDGRRPGTPVSLDSGVLLTVSGILLTASQERRDKQRKKPVEKEYPEKSRVYVTCKFVSTTDRQVTNTETTKSQRKKTYRSIV
jgi:cytidylate kinase